MNKNEILDIIKYETIKAYDLLIYAQENSIYDTLDIKKGRYQALRELCYKFDIVIQHNGLNIGKE